MIRSELIDIIAARNPYLYRQDAEKIVDTVIDEIAGALKQGARVELRAFFVKHRPAHSARNPKNGQAVFVEEKWVPFFRAGKEIKERLNAAKKSAL
ncbi:HU family DNA-binding protein [Agrobacterium radiobacter]|uniref:HU family DNA-binding protein n=1 Tax=Agrobacterium radiobacter TaxID=362 RepID=UPI003F85B46B